MWSFFYFQYGFRSSRSTADLLTVYLIELLALLTGLGLLELWHLIYGRLFTGFCVLVFFTNLNLLEFQVRYCVLFLLFSVIDTFEWFKIGSLHNNITVLEFFKAPFLVLYFFYYTLLNFLIMLFVILLSMLMLLLATLIVISDVICGNS